MQFHINYSTCWGEQLFLCVGVNRFRMKYESQTSWMIDIPYGLFFKDGDTIRYHYEVHKNGSVFRREEGTHILLADEMSSNSSVYDSWKESSPDFKYNSYNGHDYVDLGLSVKWATCNIGATTAEEKGNYFAWGETKKKGSYSDENYKFQPLGPNRMPHLTKYIPVNGIVLIDRIQVPIAVSVDKDAQILQAEDDAASCIWGRGWRIPTCVEWQELFENCSLRWNRNGKKTTVTFESRKRGYEGRSITFPLTGFRLFEEYCFIDDGGYYWSSSLDMNQTRSAISFAIGKDDDDINFVSIDRVFGATIRPVLSGEDN